MKTFSSFILEEQTKLKALTGTIDSEGKAYRHSYNYVAPLLSKEGREKTMKAFHGHFSAEKIKPGHGEHYDPNATHTHVLASKHEGHEAGTPVKVTHLSLDGKKVMAHTEKHGVIHMSKLARPEKLAKPAITREGFKVEGKIANNLGTKAAGSTKHAYDFHYGGEHGAKGKVKEADHAEPHVRGESKLDKGKMGQTVLKHTPEKGWHFSSEKIGKKFAETKIEGKPILQHMNEKHPKGVIEKSYRVDAPHGMAKHYLETSNVNTLHIHNKKTDTGTTFTVGHELKGKTKLGHLSDEHVHALDGKVEIAATRTGSTSILHRPNQKKMVEYSLASKNNPKEHRDLTNVEHAKEFAVHVDKHVKTKTS